MQKFVFIQTYVYKCKEGFTISSCFVLKEYESELEDLDDEEEIERRRKKKTKKKREVKTIFDAYEPDELERRHYTDKDNEIRNTDIPGKNIHRMIFI
jgi:hypothetical protein